MKKIWNTEWKKTKELWRSIEKGSELSKEIRLDVSDNSWLEEDKDWDYQLNTQYYNDSLRLYYSDEGVTILKTGEISDLRKNLSKLEVVLYCDSHRGKKRNRKSLKDEEDILLNEIKLIKSNLKWEVKDKITKLREIKESDKIRSEIDELSVIKELESPLKNKFSPHTNDLNEFFKRNRMEISSPMGVKEFNYMYNNEDNYVKDQINSIDLNERKNNSWRNKENRNLFSKRRGKS